MTAASEIQPSPRPRILLVGPFFPTIGGITTFLNNTMSSTLSRSYDFRVYNTSRPLKRNVVNNTGYGAVFRGGLPRAMTAWLITLFHIVYFPYFVVSRRISLVQVQLDDYLMFWEGSVYLLISNLMRRPTIARVSGGSFDRFFCQSPKPIRRLIAIVLRRSDCLIVLSARWRAFIEDCIQHENIAIVHNWVPGTKGEEGAWSTRW